MSKEPRTKLKEIPAKKITPIKVIVILGTTASGKTALGVRLARELGGEIISADSRQVYRGMDLGTGKDLEEYKNVPYHLIDIVSPRADYNLARWLKSARQTISEVTQRGRVPLVVGGSALYLNALIQNYQLSPEPTDLALRQKLNAQTLAKLVARLERLAPELARNTDLKNPRRVARALEKVLLASKSAADSGQPRWRATSGMTNTPAYQFLILGLTYPRPELRQRILERLQTRFKAGMAAEVARLHKDGLSWQKLDDFGLEYRFISRFLRGQLTEAEMREKLLTASCQFAKRQMTWFKKMPIAAWVKDYSEAKRLAREFLR